MSRDILREHETNQAINKQSSLGAYEPVPMSTLHVCPPLSAALREKVEAEICRLAAVYRNTQAVDAVAQENSLRWLLREADALAEKEEKAK